MNFVYSLKRANLMAYDIQLADRIRLYLNDVPKLKVKEKTMFSGMAFLVNGKMCVNVSGENLMCRIDPEVRNQVMSRKGFIPMVMRGKELKGYCYVKPDGFRAKRDFEFWMQLCLAFNPKAKASKK
jgi:hypothetical protein